MLRVVAALVVLTLVAPVSAESATLIRRDAVGRAITFDVPARANVDLLASTLRGALHGDEIESVTIRIVSRSTVARLCGATMVSCYRSHWRDDGEILIPFGTRSTRSVLLHEYAHHLDATYGLTSAWGWTREPAARRWWRARRIDARLQGGQVTWDYELGWQRSVGEILAEDYVQLHGRSAFGIRWLRAPGASVLTRLRADVREALSRDRS